MTEKISIYIGADYPEWLPMQVLIHSIRRHTDRKVEFSEISNDLVPEVTNPGCLPYTRFSFGRFAIPKLKGFQGKAIYLDSDMLVFRDITELWESPFNDAKILTVDPGGAGGSSKKAAVMLMDCQALQWDPDEIIGNLGKKYEYNELMSFSPLLDRNEMLPGIRHGWNCLDTHNDDTRLIHYTDITTQPWVSLKSRWRRLWLDELCLMLETKTLIMTDIQQEITKGNIRPSIVEEVESILAGREISDSRLMEIDHSTGYIPHKELYERHKQNKHAKWTYERDMDPANYSRNIYKQAIKEFYRHPFKFILKKKYRLHLEKLQIR